MRSVPRRNHETVDGLPCSRRSTRIVLMEVVDGQMRMNDVDGHDDTLAVAVEIAYGYVHEDRRPRNWRGDEH